jgi:hypothetical protein
MSLRQHIFVLRCHFSVHAKPRAEFANFGVHAKLRKLRNYFRIDVRNCALIFAPTAG